MCLPLMCSLCIGYGQFKLKNILYCKPRVSMTVLRQFKVILCLCLSLSLSILSHTLSLFVLVILSPLCIPTEIVRTNTTMFRRDKNMLLKLCTQTLSFHWPFQSLSLRAFFSKCFLQSKTNFAN